MTTAPQGPWVPLDRARHRTSVKWRIYPPDVLPVWVAEMDVELAVPIVDAIESAVRAGDLGYATGAGYAEAVAGFAAARWGWDGLDPARTAIVPDVMLGAVEMLRLVTGPGDTVVVNPPVYPPFYGFLRNLERRVCAAPLDDAGRLDLDVLAEAFTAARAGGRSAAYLLCSPHNPTGTVHTADELAAVAELAGRYGVRVVVDEIHAPMTASGVTFVPYLSVPGTDDGLTLISGSKGWNLAGLKAALAVAGLAAAADLARLPEEVGHGVNHLGVIAHTAAFRDGGDWLDTVRSAVDANRRLLADLLADHLPQVGYAPGQATFLAWLDCRGLGLGGDPAAVFLDRGRVALSSGVDFGAGGAGHARLNLAAAPETITEAVRRMAAAVAVA
ncbi:aminotransferase class I/II-fold pyridoxal phosphate-dependent enzyme [Solwaraspora sp. WMMD406]|uniref:aminotransferase class I/II-fold pyridoxal phosphate-dependent enzyme n=1 Tax=Solwaraspora sp. WMMD406 TaxID=3016095 RepID=UPI00241647D7|nr:aminotransferase class I/II-fold pyridoxal phosphate-dependent enzyme [Solwaraspora sp. WMMD406]MDG4766694.1 aminotransferase class I/II-fold pyridoxal phosphate-dependent enzyme [Solwaraspora sp. WMMD406]